MSDDEDRQMNLNAIDSTISDFEYRLAFKQCDGICASCREWKDGGAFPEDEQVYCPECDNHTVYGIARALQLGVVRIK
jgi:hypothetical protein